MISCLHSFQKYQEFCSFQETWLYLYVNKIFWNATSIFHSISASVILEYVLLFDGYVQYHCTRKYMIEERKIDINE